MQGYDFYGAWEPQTNHQSQLRNPAANPAPANQRFSVDGAISKYLRHGCPGQQARRRRARLRPRLDRRRRTSTTVSTRTAAPPPGTYEAGIEDYDVLKNRPGTVFRDNTNGAVWKYDGSTFWSYDDPQLVQSKGAYVKANGLGGLMIWSLDGDDGCLVTAMQTGLQ